VHLVGDGLPLIPVLLGLLSGELVESEGREAREGRLLGGAVTLHRNPRCRAFFRWLLAR
jgi:hypothetical protein